MQTAVLIILCHMKGGGGAKPAKMLQLLSWKSARIQEIKNLSRPNSKDVKAPKLCLSLALMSMAFGICGLLSKVLAMTGLLDRKNRPLENRQFVTVATVRRGLRVCSLRH